MHLFLLFAIGVWYAAYQQRRRWQAFAILALGVPIVPLIFRVYDFIFNGSFLPPDGAVMDVISMTYAATLLLIGGFLAVMPRTTALFPCQSCRYELLGNVSGRCPECGTDIPRSQRIAMEDHEYHHPSAHAPETEPAAQSAA